MEAGAPRHIKSLDRRRPKIQIEKDGAEVFLKPVMNLAADREKERKLRLSNLESGRPPGWGRITGRRIFRHDAHAEIRKSHGRKQSLSLFGFFQNIGGNRDVCRNSGCQAGVSRLIPCKQTGISGKLPKLCFCDAAFPER